jgi:outer membrane lipoprotein carrier protein
MSLTLRGIAVALLCWVGVAQSQTPTAAELAKQVQAHYNGVKDFTAGFTHTYKGGVLRQTLTERGSVKVKKPGRMYWTYEAPEKKEFVADGSKIYSYMKADRVVYVTDLPAGDEATTAVLFLSGKGDLTRDFQASLPATHPAGAWELRLTPRKKQAEFTTLTLLVDRKSLALKGLTSTDEQNGVSSFTFTNLRENAGLTDNQFVFKPPRGVEVIR